MISKKRTQDAAGDLVGAGDQAIGLMHGDHHGAVVIGDEQGFAGFLGLHALGPAQGGEAARKAFEVLAFGGVDDADAFERDVQALGGFLDFGAVANKDGNAEPQRMKLTGRLQAHEVPCPRGKQSAWGAAVIFR